MRGFHPQIGSSSCQWSTILIGQRKETMRFVFIWWEDEESGERQVRNEIIEEVIN